MTAEDYIPTNRQKARAAKRALVWCPGCDRGRVSLVEKCKICGTRVNRKKVMSL